jgi:hypothetical protein
MAGIIADDVRDFRARCAPVGLLELSWEVPVVCGEVRENRLNGLD